MTGQSFDIYAPLQDFHWDGADFELSPGLWIRRFQRIPDLQGWNTHLSEDEQNRLSYAKHWLTFRWDEGAQPSPSETTNLALLSLWLVKPTRTHVAFRFQIGTRAGVSGSGRSRLLDRFQWIPNAVTDEFDTAELQSASGHYAALHPVLCRRGRLNDALLLTLAGCFARRWQVALTCYASAAETILNYSSAPGLTRRLCSAYVCLVESSLPARQAAYSQFKALYAIRSDIVHGRAHNVPASDRLVHLASFAEAIRRLWRAVIGSGAATNALEGDDGRRKTYIRSIEAGFSPPP